MNIYDLRIAEYQARTDVFSFGVSSGATLVFAVAAEHGGMTALAVLSGIMSGILAIGAMAAERRRAHLAKRLEESK